MKDRNTAPRRISLQEFRLARRFGPASRRGQSLVEFAVVALVVYLLLAAILTFGHALYVAQGLQTAADLGASEIASTPLSVNTTLEEAFEDGSLSNVYSEDFLVFDLDSLTPGQDFFRDVVPTWPLLNQQLAPLMILNRIEPDIVGNPSRRLLRYPGALIGSDTSPSGFTVQIPVIDPIRIPPIRLVPVVEEIESETNPDPFLPTSPQRGIVALRINYPFQSASMSSFESSSAWPPEPNIASPTIADEVENVPFGTHSGQQGLGVQAALGQRVRPYRRVISAQAIYRREVFLESVAPPVP